MLLSFVACTATRLQNLASLIHPAVAEASKYADSVINSGFQCSSMDSCGDCFFSGCFWQPAAQDGTRCQPACMISTTACYGTFAPYEIPPPHNVISCPGGSEQNSILSGEKHEIAREEDEQHAADIHHAAASMLSAHLAAAATAAGGAGLSPAAARAHAATAAASVGIPNSLSLPVDRHGCAKVDGTSFCESTNSCVAHFEENCPSGPQCSAHLSCGDCTKNNCFFSPGAHGQPKCQPMCLIENGACFGTFSPIMIPPPHNHVACPALPSGPDAKCRIGMTCEQCFAEKCFWTPSAHQGYQCNSKCPVVGAVCFGTFDPHMIAFPHNVVQCPSALHATKLEAAKKVFPCTGDNTKWVKEERAWCCTNKKKGCVNTVNCKDQSRMMNWSGPVRRYCCATYQTACAPLQETVMVHPWPEAGLTRSKDGWFMNEQGGFLQSDDKDLEAFVKFTPVLAKADYTVELAFPSSPTFSRSTIIQIEASAGRQIGVVDQTQSYYKHHNTSIQWHTIGVYSLDLTSTVVLSATSHAQGPMVVAGIKFTPVKITEEVNPLLPAASVNAIPHPDPVAAGAAGTAGVAAAVTTSYKKVMVCPPDVPIAFELYDTVTEPEFGKSKPFRVGCVAGFSVRAVAAAQISTNRPFVIRYFATVFAAKAGDYLFNLTSTGRTNVFVDLDQVVSGKMKAMVMGDKSATTQVSLQSKYGKATLTAGMHKLEVQYFDMFHPTDPYLDVFYTGPGLPIAGLTAMVCNPATCSPQLQIEFEKTPPDAAYYVKNAVHEKREAERKKMAEALVKQLDFEAITTEGRGVTDKVETANAVKEVDKTVYPK